MGYNEKMRPSGLPWEGYYYSAYGIAVKHGFKGTEEEWLASLQGKDAYREAVKAGFEGTEEEFYSLLADAADAKEAAEAARDEAVSAAEDAETAASYSNHPPRISGDYWQLWDGDEYVVTSYRAIGQTGAKGDTGAQGPQGVQGVKGEKGDRGPTGSTGAAAQISGASAEITTLDAGSDATVNVTSGGSADNRSFVFTFGIPRGNKGQKGDTGNTGAAAGFGTVSATVDANVGTPEVAVTASGEDTAKNFAFTFKNLKGEKGDTGDPSPSDNTPLEDDGSGDPGESDDYSRADHVHPSDTSKADAEDVADIAEDVDDLKSALKSGDEEDAIYHLGFYLDENGDLCQVEEETNNG